MPTVILSSNADGAFFLNGSFLSTVKQKGTLSVPLGTSPSFISFFPVIKDRLPVFALLEYEHSLLKCSHCRGELLRWSDSIYEFFVFSDEKPPSLPPIVTCESQWGNGFAGIAGGHFVCQDKNGSRCQTGFLTEKFRILSENFILLENGSSLAVINKNTDFVLPPVTCAEYSFDGKILSVTFSVGKMDFFKISQTFSVVDMHLLSSDCRCEDPSSPSCKIRCFCQAVRLNLKENALRFLSDSFKSDTSFDDIRNFLGTFDETDLPRHIFTEKENTVALRYMLDENNFHYNCFYFPTDNNGLIDDIVQL